MNTARTANTGPRSRVTTPAGMTVPALRWRVTGCTFEAAAAGHTYRIVRTRSYGIFAETTYSVFIDGTRYSGALPSLAGAKRAANAQKNAYARHGA